MIYEESFFCLGQEELNPGGLKTIKEEVKKNNYFENTVEKLLEITDKYRYKLTLKIRKIKKEVISVCVIIIWST